MQIRVVPYDPAWPQAFAIASAEITRALARHVLETHHIGSTSIPALHAKPVIDMLAVVHDISAVDAQNAQMQLLGYEPMGEFGIPGRRYFRRDDPKGVRTHQLHTFQIESPHIQRHLAFRDYMRTHADAAKEYANLKRRLAEAHPDDMEAYMDGKEGFIKQMEAKALAWACGG